MAEGVTQHWQHGAVIAYTDEVTDELYNFILPQRAHYLPSGDLKPIVLMIEKE